MSPELSGFDAGEVLERIDGPLTIGQQFEILISSPFEPFGPSVGDPCASDDFGLEQVTLKYSVNGGDWQTVVTVRPELTPFLDAGFAGLNSAYIDGSAVYHTPQDREHALLAEELGFRDKNVLFELTGMLTEAKKEVTPGLLRPSCVAMILF